MQSWHSIPDNLIINFDQTPLPYVVTDNSTLNEKDTKSVPLQGKGKKKKITGTFAVSKRAEFLPMQLIYEGKTHQCLTKDIKFPKEFDVTFTSNHWSNEEKSKQLLDNAIIPYRKKKNHDLGLSRDQKSLLIYNVFTVQTTENIKEYIEENDCVIAYVPNNMTNYFQPLGLTVNAAAKHFLKDKLELWYANEVKKQLEEGNEVYEIDIPLKLSILKPIHGIWFLGLYEHLLNNKQIIINGFESAGITEAVTQELPNEDPFADLD